MQTTDAFNWTPHEYEEGAILINNLYGEFLLECKTLVCSHIFTRTMFIQLLSLWLDLTSTDSS